MHIFHLSYLHALKATIFIWFPYHISLVITQSFFPSKNNLKNLDLSNKMDLDLWDYLERVKLIL